MATGTYWQRGESIDYVNGTGSKISANTIILAGSLLGVAGTDIESGESGSMIIAGIFELPKVTGTALTLGQQVQWDNSNGYIKAHSTGDVHGIVVANAASAADKVYVKINA